MNIIDILFITVLAGYFIFLFIKTIKMRKKGKNLCCGGCASCNNTCVYKN